jgi:hypothetical protein
MIIYYIEQYKEMSDKEMLNEDNAYVNQLTLNFLISKNQLQKLNKLKQKEQVLEPEYDKKRISQLFNQLLNNDRPDDLLEDVKICFDAFIEKSIYYLETHDKNEIIQNERNEQIKDDINYEDEEDIQDEEDDVQDEEDEEDEDEDVQEETKEVIKPYIKYSKKNNISNGVEDLHKLPVDWFNSARQNYKINQIIPRKKEIVIENTVIKKKYN